MVVGEFDVVANVGDNFWMSGLYICPDVDTAMYTLAGVSDTVRGWGVRRDTFRTLDQLGRLGGETWFQLGDRDLATHLYRTQMLKQGSNLTKITATLCKSLGVRQRILPSTDSDVETRIRTTSGEMHLQEFWVKHGGRPRVTGVKYAKAGRAVLSSEVRAAISEADRVVFCPGNPITSIGPILAIPGMRELLSGSGARTVAVSPMVGKKPLSGPAGKLMTAVGARHDSVGVAELYSGLVDVLVISDEDLGLKRRVEREGMECVVSETVMRDKRDEVRLAELAVSC